MRTAEARFFEKVRPAPAEECWLWRGAVGGHGYGNFYAEGGYVRAHRWSWAFFRGEIPDGLHIDHLCRTRLCVNPWHADLVTPGENCARADNPTSRNRAKTHCPAGHELVAGNLLTAQIKRGWRECRTCANTRQRLRKAA